MSIALTWVLALFLLVAGFLPGRSRQPTDEKSALVEGNTGSRGRGGNPFSAFDFQDWALFVGGVCYLIAALAMTIDALT